MTSPSRRYSTLALALAAAGAVGVGPAVAQSWQRPPYDVSVFPLPADDPQLQAAPNGAVTFVWEGWTGDNWQIRARTRGPRGGFTPTVTLSPAGADHEDPRLAIGRDGTTSVIWKNMRNWNRRVQIRTRRPGGAFGPTTTLSGARADATEDRIAIGPSGQTAVAWAYGQSGRRALQFRERPAGARTFGPVLTLSPRGQGEVDPAIVYAPDGTVTVTWELANSRQSIAYARIRRPGEAFGPIIPLSLPNGRATDVMAAVGPGGVVTAVWERVGGGGVRVQSRTIAPDGALGPIQDLSGVARHASDADVAIAPDGTTTVLWEIDFTRRDLKVAQARTRAAGATEWGPVQTLTTRPRRTSTDASGPDVDDPVLAVAPGGTVTAAWKQLDGVRGVRVQSRTRRAGGSWGPLTWLSAPHREADEPRITAAPNGAFTVVWKLATGLALYPEQDFALQGITTRAGR